MPDPFPPQNPQGPVPPQQPYPPQQAFPSFPQGPMQPQAPPRSGGCFKGCCIVAVILAVIGVIGLIVVATQWKKFTTAMFVEGMIKPSDLTEPEKKEAEEIVAKLLEGVQAGKITQPQFQDFMDGLNRAGRDQKYEARELRPVFAKAKLALKAAGYPFPSELFPSASEEVSAGKGGWRVVVTSVPKGKAGEAAAAVAAHTKIGETGAAAILKDLPATVMEGAAQEEAEALAAELEDKGCEVEVNEVR